MHNPVWEDVKRNARCTDTRAKCLCERYMEEGITRIPYAQSFSTIDNAGNAALLAKHH